MTGNEVTWPKFTGSDPEVTSVDWKSPGSGCRRPISQVLGSLSFYRAVTRRRWESCDGK